MSIRRFFILAKALGHMLLLAIRFYKNLPDAIRAFRLTIRFRSSANNHSRMPKYYCVNNKCFMSPNIPGYPSPAFDKFFVKQFNTLLPRNPALNNLQLVLFSITGRCFFKCTHCYEEERINQVEHLDIGQLLKIQKKIETSGISQIHYTGGEPMIRIDDVITLLKAKQPSTECWIFTSGYNFTLQNAHRLKDAGLCGAFISIDHWDPESHNNFRRSDKAWDRAVNAARNCVASNLALCLSVCTTNEFITRDNLFKYLDLALSLRAGFVQFLEPGRVGGFRNRDVELKPEKIKILAEFMSEINNHSAYKKWPTIIFPGYHQRKTGCLGSGNQYFYIDSTGDAHACPFCQRSAGNCLEYDIDDIIRTLRQRGCPRFPEIREEIAWKHQLLTEP